MQMDSQAQAASPSTASGKSDASLVTEILQEQQQACWHDADGMVKRHDITYTRQAFANR